MRQVNHEFVVVDSRTFLTSEQQSLQARSPCAQAPLPHTLPVMSVEDLDCLELQTALDLLSLPRQVASLEVAARAPCTGGSLLLSRSTCRGGLLGLTRRTGAIRRERRDGERVPRGGR